MPFDGAQAHSALYDTEPVSYTHLDVYKRQALLRIRLAVSLADIADADSGPAVAIQFR